MSKRVYQIGSVLVGVLIVLSGFQNCGNTGMESSKGDDAGKVARELQQLKTLLEQINAEDLSCSVDADCTLVAVGHRPCGGPEDYVIASKLNPRHEEVLSVSLLHQQKSQQENIRQNRIGTCEAILPPAVGCDGNVCAARPSN